MTADLCEAELLILFALHLLEKCNVTVSEVHCQILIALSGIRGFTRGPNVSPALE
jgi:hypothetical protein